MPMTDEQAAGMWWGLFIGDAMGCPLEFTKPNLGKPVTTFTTGGVHNVSLGEYSDDGAMAYAIAAAYIQKGEFCATTIQQNFLQWMRHGTYGTRLEEPAWDVGITVMGAIRAVKDELRPYGGSTYPLSSGNGCIMRMAPCIIWNRQNLGHAIGQSVAQALITHGSTDCITYTSALAHELWAGKALPQYEGLKNRPIKNSGYVADTYASAWHSVRTTQSFDDAIIDAINRGGDADTVGAVTGMIAGRLYGCTVEHPWVKQIQNYKILNGVFDQLLALRNNTLF